MSVILETGLKKVCTEHNPTPNIIILFMLLSNSRTQSYVHGKQKAVYVMLLHFCDTTNTL